MTGKTERGSAPFAALSRQRLVQYFFFGVFLLLLYQVARILSPFFIGILGSAVLALVIYPIHARVLARLKSYPTLAAVATTSTAVLIVILPILLFGWVFLKETAKVYPAAQAWMEGVRRAQSGGPGLALPEQLRGPWEAARNFLEFWNIDLQDILLKNLDELSSTVTYQATRLIKNTVFVAFNLMVLVFTLFFFLRDGPFIIQRLVELIPMAPDHKQVILDRIEDTLYAVLRGVLIVALVQGFLTGVGLAMFGVPFPVLLGVFTTFLSPIPVVGGAGVWIPVVVCLFLQGSVQPAIYLTLWCSIVVGLIDNILRPILIGAHAKIPLILLFFGLLGGLRVYGFIGLLLGPILIALVLAFINIYRQEYQWLLQQQPARDSR